MKADQNDSTAGRVRVRNYRWVIVALLFAAMVINYTDRQMVGFLKPDYLQPEFGWSERDYARIVFWFQATYALSYLLFGRVIDRLGAKWGLATAFVIWSLAQIAHAGARSLGDFVAVRIALAVGEGGAFPGAVRAVADWFPRSERALAIGVFNAGTNIGAIVTPLIVPFLVVDLSLGWRASFLIIGLASLIWLPAWIVLYVNPALSKRVSKLERAWIASDAPEPIQTIPWARLLRTRAAWGYALARMLTDPIWWMFLFWLPDFLSRNHGLNISSFGAPIIAIYVLADIGSVGGGWLSSRLIARGHTVRSARGAAMLVCALCALPVLFAPQAQSLWLAVLLIGMATAAHQGFSANLYALTGDVFPRGAVAGVVGFGGFCGGIGGMAFAAYVGEVLQRTSAYGPIFFVSAFAYLIALGVVSLLMLPDAEPKPS